MKKIVALDMEFNTVGKIQEIISVGAVIMDEKFKVLNTYENYIKLSLTKRLDPQSQKIHKIKKETLDHARGFQDVFEELMYILDLNPGDIVITWGNNDRINIGKNARAHGCGREFRVLTKRIRDVQPIIQRKVRYKGELIENQLSLETMRQICGLKEEVSHNALDDAKCLADIYKFANNKKIISNDKILEKVFAKQEAKKEAKKIRLESYYEVIDGFINEFENGLTFYDLPQKAIRQIRTIMNEPKANHNIRNIAGNKNDLITKDGYLIKDGMLSGDVTCSISIIEKKLRIEFEKGDQIYWCQMLVCNSTADRVQNLIKALELGNN